MLCLILFGVIESIEANEMAFCTFRVILISYGFATHLVDCKPAKTVGTGPSIAYSYAIFRVSTSSYWNGATFVTFTHIYQP